MGDNIMDIPRNITVKYPWLEFVVDLRNLPIPTWIQLGECVSKCRHLEKIPLKPRIAIEMHRVYLAKGVSATTAIEGNTLSEEQVRQILEKKLELPPSRQYLKQEVDNILFLCNEIKTKMCSGNKFVMTPQIIKYLNKGILRNVPVAEYVVPGEFRTVPVVAGTYRAVDAVDVEPLVKALSDWLNSDSFSLPDCDPIAGNIIKAITAHLYIEWIHPFGDGNGRLGRLIEFAILASAGVPSPAAHLLSNHYNQTRTEYYRRLSTASQKRDINDFVAYAIQGFRDGLTEQLQYVFRQILDISWETFVYEKFKELKRSEKAKKRMRTLVLELSRRKEAVPKEKLTSMSPALIELFRPVRSARTLTRDLNDLIRANLINRTPNGYRARKERMYSFLPSGTSWNNA
jgi:Fic family protein